MNLVASTAALLILTLGVPSLGAALTGKPIRLEGARGQYVLSTDARGNNVSHARLVEPNSSYGNDTVFELRCQPGASAAVVGELSTRFFLTVPGEPLPTLTLRLGQRAPRTLRKTEVLPGRTQQSVQVTPGAGHEIAEALAQGERLVLDVQRPGRSLLRYTFPASGFNIAWQAMNHCGRRAADGGQDVPPLVGLVPAGVAPKLLSWNFRGCRDGRGRVTPALVPDELQTCDLLIKTVPNGAQVISALISFEQEFDGKKVPVQGAWEWNAWASRPDVVNVKVFQHRDLISVLVPFASERDAERVYVRVQLFFHNGGHKTVYEPLPVQGRSR